MYLDRVRYYINVNHIHPRTYPLSYDYQWEPCYVDMCMSGYDAFDLTCITFESII